MKTIALIRRVYPALNFRGVPTLRHEIDPGAARPAAARCAARVRSPARSVSMED